MTKRTILTLNFSTTETQALKQALSNVGADVNLTSANINHLDFSKNSFVDVALILFKLKDSKVANDTLLQKAKQHFVHFPLILISELPLDADKASH